MTESVRVAFFACAYDEIDGVATTSRQFVAFARSRNLPTLLVHGGASEVPGEREGSVVRYGFRRRWPKFPLDRNHDYDLNFWRHYGRIETTLREFRPDVIHVTGPSDVGQIGALAAHRLRVPLAASWHTNVHEYAESRLEQTLSFLPSGIAATARRHAREISFRLSARFYRIARSIFAPNRELVKLLESHTGKRVHLMTRGVDAELFRPADSCNRETDEFTIGYVGRLTPEKNVRFLERLESALRARSHSRYRFLIVGQGSEEAWLRANLKQAVFTGVLRGEPLAAAYRSMDAFAFPSLTDTFGNVVQEAAASGVPAVVTDGGGPKYIVAHGETGFVSRNETEFVGSVILLMTDAALLGRMRAAARQRALRASWDAVFESVYAVYRHALTPPASELNMLGTPAEAHVL